MEAAKGSPNSKVIVQFSDPSNLFEEVAPLLQNRLPLGNLHWKSPTRPLRSIEELDISLDREQRASADGTNTARRHQIPGLRQTPFVKVLLLRCDDKEKYKESVRKDAKEWVKRLGFSTSGKATTKGQERHDAFEYLILHVVLPGTPAAIQPKSSKHISLEATESTDSINSKSKWTGKSTSTVLDKLRADFASSSKAPFERVAQVRLNDLAKPSAALSPLELEEQWQDLVDKLKTAILQSFDARVAQYEEDIRERESQRNLPGWNFCTFFILKEGLAKGFENVGLLEDALQIYEELDAGLDVVIQDQAKAEFADTANALLPYAADLKDIIRTVLHGQSAKNDMRQKAIPLSLQGWTEAEAHRFPWKLERRDYQQMILTNQVSALDFRIYIFIRQMQLMLRRASMSIPLPKAKQNRQSGPRWDADLLSGVCERSVKFMNLAARNLRQDLYAAWGGQAGLPEDELKIQKVAVDNIVASWKWASLLQTLFECQIITSFSNLTSRKGDVPAGQLFSPADITNSRSHGSEASVSTISSNGTNTTNGSGTVTAKDMFASLRVVKGSKSDLVYWSAELFTMMRTIFVRLCRQSTLLPDVFRGSRVGGYVVEDSALALVGVLSPSLNAMIKEEDVAFGAYKLLTVCACQCYTTAGKSRASKHLLFDLASLEMHNQNYEAALEWLDAIPGFLDAPPKTSVEQSMLRLYIGCLRRTKRYADLVQSLMLDIQAALYTTREASTVQDSWKEALAIASRSELFEFPFDLVFQLEQVNEFINVDSNSDGCGLTISLRFLVGIHDFGKMEAKLIAQSHSSTNPSHLTFTYENESFTHDLCSSLVLSCPVSVEGWYDLVNLSLKFGNIIFRLDLQPPARSEDDDTAFAPSSIERKSVYIYPTNGSPKLSLAHAHVVDLSQRKKALLHVASGSHDISSARLRLRPATAGLRLDLLSATSNIAEGFSVERIDDGHILQFESLSADSQYSIEIPYSFDDVTAVTGAIRAELRYLSSDTEYEMFEHLEFMTLLPIGVNVQDIFLTNSTFSRFTLAPSRLIPLSILDCDLEAPASIGIVTAEKWNEPIDAFPKQPASWVVQLKSNPSEQQQQPHKKLALSVSYQCMDEAILESIMSTFHQALKDTDQLAKYTRPLTSHLRNKIQTLWSEQDIEIAVLTSEIEIWTFEQVNWSTLLPAFGKQARHNNLEHWLRQWHAQNPTIPLRRQTAPIRTLRLLVDTPSTDVLVTTEVRLPSQRTHCVVGQPILATLSARARISGSLNVEIAVEVLNQSDLWLVGGQRKVMLTTDEPKAEVVIVLVPQKTGSLILPPVDVKCRRAVEAQSGAEASARSVSFEVENLSVAAAVVVTSRVRSTTVAIGEGKGTDDGHWLVDSRLAKSE